MVFLFGNNGYVIGKINKKKKRKLDFKSSSVNFFKGVIGTSNYIFSSNSKKKKKNEKGYGPYQSFTRPVPTDIIIYHLQPVTSANCKNEYESSCGHRLIVYLLVQAMQ